METIYQCCAGLDVHQKTVVVCVRRLDANGRLQKSVRTYGTFTTNLRALADWLAEEGVTHVAMESTGVLWKPVYNLLEGRFEVLLVNAQHLKQVPGRKTDVKDCEWIAQLLQHGLLRGSFVPAPAQRELRDLTRHRAKLVEEKTAVVNRVHKTLEDANIKLGAVASDILGVSGRAMLEALVAGEENPQTMAELARRRMRGKIPQLKLALEGHLTVHHRFLLKMLLEHIDSLERFVQQLDQRIEELLRPFAEELRRLMTIPGVSQTTAQSLLAEIGTDMGQFPSMHHLSSWSGLCPGNHESAGKRQKGKTRKGNRWLRRTLCQAAWAASHTKDSYPSARFRRLASRRGKKRAIVAVGHTLLQTAYHLLKRQTDYKDLGADYFDKLHPDRLTRQLVKRLERLGHTVVLDPPSEAA
jgi:transposase